MTIVDLSLDADQETGLLWAAISGVRALGECAARSLTNPYAGADSRRFDMERYIQSAQVAVTIWPALTLPIDPEPIR